MIRDKIKKYPMRAHGITTQYRYRDVNFLGGIYYFTIYSGVSNVRTKNPLCITIRDFEPNSAFFTISGGLSC